MACILLAEDDASMRNFLSQALERGGHTVDVAADGLQALAMLDSDKSKYDLLLTDIVMPGMDGVELAQRASDLCSKLKVMFITGFAAVAMKDKKLRENQSKVLSKPFHLKELVDQVDTLLKAA